MRYFEKHALYPPLIDVAPEVGLALAITIPCHDEPDLLQTLNALNACVLPPKPVEVIVVINSAENAPEEVKTRNAETFKQAQVWAKTHNKPGLKFHILQFSDLPPKHAGVGLARKIAMDEAARRLPSKGVIACLDADTLVQPNYIQALAQYFEENPGCPAAGIYYEHPIEGQDYAPEIYEAIARYELHLRYYVHALRWAGLPTATQTVGSAMAVRADAYQAQGGMNRRQAGEDFYFLHKFTPLAGFGEITSTTVIPSPRVSHRVPFGTGKAVGDMLTGQAFLTYAPQTFWDLRIFLSGVCIISEQRELPAVDYFFYHGGTEDTEFASPCPPCLRGENLDATEQARTSDTASTRSLPAAISTFLENENFSEKLRELQANTASPEAFRKRFFRWFDAFRAMKYVHHARDQFYTNVPVEEAATWKLGMQDGTADVRELLLLFRKLDKAGK